MVAGITKKKLSFRYIFEAVAGLGLFFVLVFLNEFHVKKR